MAADHQPIIGETLKERWIVGKKLGVGSFGIIYETTDKNDNKIYAMKVESTVTKPSNLKVDLAALRRVSGQLHFCTLIDSGRAPERFTFLIMTLLGRNLDDLRRSRPDQRFTAETVARVAVHTMEATKILHSVGFLHRDIKPSNLAIGAPPNHRTVHLLDFGLGRIFIKSKLDHSLQPKRPNIGIRGSPYYSSPLAQAGNDTGRCDDMWSILYSLIEMLTGSLPWCDVQNMDQMAEIKNKFNSTTLTGQLFEYDQFRKNILKLSFQDEPEYDNYIVLFDSILKKGNYSADGPWEWE